MFTVNLKDGTTARIARKRMDGERTILEAEDGTLYTPADDNPLYAVPLEAGDEPELPELGDEAEARGNAGLNAEEEGIGAPALEADSTEAAPETDPEADEALEDDNAPAFPA